MVFPQHIWMIISSKLDPETWYKTQLISKDFHLDTLTQRETHYKKASRPFAKKLLELATDFYLDEFQHIILPFDLKKAKEILSTYVDIYVYDNRMCGMRGPRGFRGCRGRCSAKCDGGVTCRYEFIPYCTYCGKYEGRNRKCPICQDKWKIPFEISNISISNPPKYKYTPNDFQNYFKSLIKKDSDFEWEEMHKPSARYSIIQT